MTKDFKDSHWHTQAQAISMVKRLRKIAKPEGYVTALFGSTLLNGEGHDIDISILGSVGPSISPAVLALRIIKKHVKEIFMYRRDDGEEVSDIWMVFLTHDNLYVDLYIKGEK